MLELLDVLAYESKAIQTCSPDEQLIHGARLEVAALQLAALLDSKWPDAYAPHLTCMVRDAFALLQEITA